MKLQLAMVRGVTSPEQKSDGVAMHLQRRTAADGSRAVANLACDNIPFLGGGDQHLRLLHLFLGQLHVSRQFLHHQSCKNTKPCQQLEMQLCYLRGRTERAPIHLYFAARMTVRQARSIMTGRAAELQKKYMRQRTKRSEAMREGSCDLRGQCFHGRHVHNFEVVQLHDVVACDSN